MDPPPSSSIAGEGASPILYQEAWKKRQDLLRSKLVVVDDFPWSLESCDCGLGGLLRYVGGVDVSFAKDDASIACGALVVIDLRQREGREIVYETLEVVRLRVPYVPGFLAFREAPILLRLLEKTKSEAPSVYPQLLMVDGNGILHPRGFGLACHLGVLADLPTIGVGKNLHHVDGLSVSRVNQLFKEPENASKELVTLIGDSGRVWGAAIRSTPGSEKPIFVSVGNRISLESCIKVVQKCCKFRVPEPIRQADIKSRHYLQSIQSEGLKYIHDELVKTLAVTF